MRPLHLFLVLLLAAGTARNASAIDPPSDRGGAIYARICAGCHLPDPRQDRPARAIGVDGGVLRALETIDPMRFLQGSMTARDIADVQAFLDTFAVGYVADVRALNGNWFDPATEGQGFSLALTAEGSVSALFFGHRDDGSNQFLVGGATRRPRFGQTIDIPMSSVSGGRFTAFDPARIRYDNWGTLRLRFETCTRATAELVGRDGRQVLTLQPLTLIEGLDCE